MLCLELHPASRFCNLDLKSAVSTQAGKSQCESFCKSSAIFIIIIITFSPHSLRPCSLQEGWDVGEAVIFLVCPGGVFLRLMQVLGQLFCLGQY